MLVLVRVAVGVAPVRVLVASVLVGVGVAPMLVRVAMGVAPVRMLVAPVLVASVLMGV